ADPEFHARYAAVARTYRYVLINRAVRPALAAAYAGWYHQPLDLAAMSEAANLLVGQHDFSAFRSSECQAKSPVRSLYGIDIDRQGERIDFVVRANAFLHHMVRNLVGSLVYVGKGKHSPNWVSDLLASRERSLAAPTFSACGLYLEQVEYPDRYSLPKPGGAPFALALTG
ncbi:MAG: tRNA pseudouridine synthase A, partial [Betaproteobacteria bacterium]|nr:tRNA pseudouridine synthase A [Betaproteobacteria bacterium]